MSGSTTPNYHFDLPTVGASQDTWGGKLNANWTLADSAIHNLASGYLPLTGGGTINGNLGVTGSLGVTGAGTINGNLGVGGNLGATGSITGASVNASGAVTSGGAMECGGGLAIETGQVADFDMYRLAPERVLQWGAGYNMSWNEGDGGSLSWNNPSIQQMKLDPAGNLAVHGTVHGTNVLLAGGLSVGDVLRELLARVTALEAHRA